jgi:predicted class III extradiol MEMO1 family dioxygenase
VLVFADLMHVHFAPFKVFVGGSFVSTERRRALGTRVRKYSITLIFIVSTDFIHNGKGTAIPLQACTGPEGSRSFRLPDFKTNGTWIW